MPDAEIYARLTTHEGVVAIVGDHVYPVVAPQGAVYPLVTYQRISDVPSVAIDGPIMSRDARYQASCYSTSRKEMRALAEQVIDALHMHRGAVIKGCLFDSANEVLETGAGPAGEDLFHCPVDFIVTF